MSVAMMTAAEAANRRIPASADSIQHLSTLLASLSAELFEGFDGASTGPYDRGATPSQELFVTAHDLGTTATRGRLSVASEDLGTHEGDETRVGVSGGHLAAAVSAHPRRDTRPITRELVALQPEDASPLTYRGALEPLGEPFSPAALHRRLNALPADPSQPLGLAEATVPETHEPGMEGLMTEQGIPGWRVAVIPSPLLSSQGAPDWLRESSIAFTNGQPQGYQESTLGYSPSSLPTLQLSQVGNAATGRQSTRDVLGLGGSRAASGTNEYLGRLPDSTQERNRLTILESQMEIQHLIFGLHGELQRLPSALSGEERTDSILGAAAARVGMDAGELVAHDVVALMRTRPEDLARQPANKDWLTVYGAIANRLRDTYGAANSRVLDHTGVTLDQLITLSLRRTQGRHANVYSTILALDSYVDKLLSSTPGSASQVPPRRGNTTARQVTPAERGIVTANQASRPFAVGTIISNARETATSWARRAAIGFGWRGAWLAQLVGRTPDPQATPDFINSRTHDQNKPNDPDAWVR
jgi:hypothetical protein